MVDCHYCPYSSPSQFICHVILLYLPLKEHIIFLFPTWLWTQPCDLFWPMCQGKCDRMPILSLGLKRSYIFPLHSMYQCHCDKKYMPQIAHWSREDEKQLEQSHPQLMWISKFGVFFNTALLWLSLTGNFSSDELIGNSEMEIPLIFIPLQKYKGMSSASRFSL